MPVTNRSALATRALAARHRAQCAVVLGALAALVTLAGCATPTPVVPPSPKCSPPAALTEPCAGPAAIPQRATYGDLIRLYQADRKTMRLCAERQARLAEAMQACDKAVDDYNDRLQSARTQGK